MRKIVVFSSVAAAFVIAGCGGGSSKPTPTSPTPTPTPTQTNRAPVITSLSVNPSFGISELTSFNFSASANDPDADSVNYAWDLAGNSAVGSSGSITFVGSGTATFTVTVSDGKGGTASDSRTATVGNASGTWRGAGVNLGTFTMVLKQTGPMVTGTYNDPYYGNGQIDPAQPGAINASGHIEMRMKQGRFTDFTFKGDMDQSGRRITGQIYGSGFNGEAFTMEK